MPRQERKRLLQTTAELERFGCDMLSTTLPLDAQSAYEMFCDVPRIPEWLQVIQSVGVLRRDGRNRVTRASFVARLERGTLGYSLTYAYDAQRLCVQWRSTSGQLFEQRGTAQFQPLGDRACMLQYDLVMGHEVGDSLKWQDPLFDGHPASAVVHDFRDYVKRQVAMPNLALRTAG